MNLETTSPISDDQLSNVSSLQDQTVLAPAAPHKLLSAIRIAAFAVFIMFFLPWGSVWLTSCGSPNHSSNGSVTGERSVTLDPAGDMKLGSASGWGMLRGEKYVVPTLDSTTTTISTEPQAVAAIIPFAAIIIAVLSISAKYGRVSRDFAYKAALFGSMLIGFVALYIPENVTVPADHQAVLNQVVREYTSKDEDPINEQQSDFPIAPHAYDFGASLDFRWHSASVFLIIGLLTAMGVSGIAGLGAFAYPTY